MKKKPYKILHTADWHIGKQLHKIDLNTDLSMFFEWVLKFIKKEEIQVLLVSGDVFDTATPSNEDRRIYFELLRKLVDLKVKVIITAGNHDSISQLDAPKDILEWLNIHVVGRITADFEREIVEFKDDSGELISVVLAAPFIRDTDFRKYATDTVFAQQEEMKSKVVSYYRSASEEINKRYDTGIPSIAMGHLFISGSSISDSERDIEVGSLGGIATTQLEGLFDYMALGHIHKPQIFAGGSVQYSGSPIALSFSERKDQKKVNIIEIESGNLSVTQVEIPTFRRLIKVRGSFREVREKISKQIFDTPLPTLLELEIIEEERDLDLLYAVQEYSRSEQGASYEVVQLRVLFGDPSQSKGQEIYQNSLDDLSPVQLFDEILQTNQITEASETELRQSFRELLQRFENQQSK
jgi:DNA repair protein SbcD/Mre11